MLCGKGEKTVLDVDTINQAYRRGVMQHQGSIRGTNANGSGSGGDKQIGQNENFFGRTQNICQFGLFALQKTLAPLS